MTVKGIDFTALDEIAKALKDTPRRELVEIIVSMTALEPLVTAAQIAAREGVNPRVVRAEMKAGKMPHPLWGPGYVCHGSNSKKVPVSAANAWRRSFFVPVDDSSEENGRNGHAK